MTIYCNKQQLKSISFCLYVLSIYVAIMFFTDFDYPGNKNGTGHNGWD